MDIPQSPSFEWDENKDRLNRKKHDVPFVLAQRNSQIIRLLMVDVGMRRQLNHPKSLFRPVHDDDLNSGPFKNQDEDSVQFEMDYFPDQETAQRSLLRTINQQLDDRHSQESF